MALGLEEGLGRSSVAQAGFQLALLVTTLAISILGGLFTGEGGREGVSPSPIPSLHNSVLCMTPSPFTGVIVRFLPAFQGINKESQYFDDKLYWEVMSIQLHALFDVSSLPLPHIPSLPPPSSQTMLTLTYQQTTHLVTKPLPPLPRTDQTDQSCVSVMCLQTRNPSSPRRQWNSKWRKPPYNTPKVGVAFEWADYIIIV